MNDIDLKDHKTPLAIEQTIVNMLRDSILRSWFDRHFLVGVLLDELHDSTEDQVNQVLMDLESRHRIKSRINERGDIEVCLSTDAN